MKLLNADINHRSNNKNDGANLLICIRAAGVVCLKNSHRLARVQAKDLPIWSHDPTTWPVVRTFAGCVGSRRGTIGQIGGYSFGVIHIDLNQKFVISGDHVGNQMV